jgi:hypothetical protein
VLEHWRAYPENRPKTRKKLVKWMLAFTDNTVAEADITKLIEKFSRDGRIKIGEKEAVSYQL